MRIAFVIKKFALFRSLQLAVLIAHAQKALTTLITMDRFTCLNIQDQKTVFLSCLVQTVYKLRRMSNGRLRIVDRRLEQIVQVLFIAVNPFDKAAMKADNDPSAVRVREAKQRIPKVTGRDAETFSVEVLTFGH